MLHSNHPWSNSLRNLLSDPGSLLFATGIAVGAVRGYQKALGSRPEWTFWDQLATQPWESVAGADQPIFGYLPGFAVVLKPFFMLPSPLGLLLFLTINAASCVGILIILRGQFWNNGGRVHPALALMTAITMYFSLQNNQVVAPSLLLTLIAYFQILRNQKLGSIALAVAILVKTLPATFLLLFTLIKRFRLSFLAGVALLALSVLLSALTEGMDVSTHAHLNLLEQFRAQDPNRVLTDGVVPSSLENNTSLSSIVVQLAPYIGNTPAYILNLVIFWSTLLLACYLSFTASRRTRNPPLILALWLCWTIMAAPFGRYYYLLFLLPAWWLLWPKAALQRHAVAVTIALWLLALSPLASKSTTVFVALVVFTFLWSVKSILQDLQKPVTAR